MSRPQGSDVPSCFCPGWTPSLTHWSLEICQCHLNRYRKWMNRWIHMLLSFLHGKFIFCMQMNQTFILKQAKNPPDACLTFQELNFLSRNLLDFTVPTLKKPSREHLLNMLTQLMVNMWEREPWQQHFCIKHGFSWAISRTSGAFWVGVVDMLWVQPKAYLHGPERDPEGCGG